jgi:GH25 family lysozyme M1 (1,4-beta-N-acetylmuramidase)
MGILTRDKYIDVSSNNALTDFNAYFKAGYRHWCRKVSEGTGYHWYEGDDQTKNAHRSGIHVGHYHWLSEGQDALAQAKLFVKLVKPLLGKKPTPGVWPPDGDWLMTDYERTSGASINDAHRAQQLDVFNNYVRHELAGYPLFTYTGNWYIDGKPRMVKALKDEMVVMSNYNYTGLGSLPNPHGLTYGAWQYSDRAHVKGQSGGVDLNRWLSKPKNYPAAVKHAKPAVKKPSPKPSPVKHPVVVIKKKLKPVYTVRKNDTLSGLAKKWHTSVQAIERVNPHAGHPHGNFNNIHIGDRLFKP